MRNYLSNDTKRQIINAPQGFVILLSAPTGSGKTHFFLNEYLNHLRLQRKRMLMVVNRSTLRTQIVQSLFRRFNVEKEIQDDLINNGYASFDCITIVSYQYLSCILADYGSCPPYNRTEKDKTSNIRPLPINADKIDTVVFDEAHFFISDALFNPEIDAFKNASRFFRDSTRIYASATLEPVRDVIFEMESIRKEVQEGWGASQIIRYTQDQKWPQDQIIPRDFERKCLELVGAKEDYSYLIPSIMSGCDEDALVKDIQGRIAEGSLKKALVFVLSKEAGQKINKRLNDSGIKSAFIFSENKGLKMDASGKEEEKSLIENEKFDSAVLLATTKIDNGINIEDSDVTHIYPFAFEQIEMKQQVGRIRIKDGQALTLVLRIPNEGEINHQRAAYQEELKLLDEYDKSSPDNKFRMLNEAVKAPKCATIAAALKSCCYTRHNGQLKGSIYAYAALEYYIQECKAALSALKRDPDNGIARKWLKWLGIEYDPDNDKRKTKTDQAKSSLEQLLANNREIPMDKKNYDDFRKSFKDLYLKAYPQEAVNSGRKDRILGPEKLKLLLEKFGYTIVRCGTGYHKLQERKEG